jgi:hypothetical protein
MDGTRPLPLSTKTSPPAPLHRRGEPFGGGQGDGITMSIQHGSPLHKNLSPGPSPQERGAVRRRTKRWNNNVYSAWLPSPVERGRGRGFERREGEVFNKQINN